MLQEETLKKYRTTLQTQKSDHEIMKNKLSELEDVDERMKQYVLVTVTV